VLGLPGGALGLEGEGEGGVLVEVVGGPELIEQVQSEVAAQGVLDDLAVGSAGAGGADPDGGEDLFVEGDRGPGAWHTCIFASRCAGRRVRRRGGPGLGGPVPPHLS